MAEKKQPERGPEDGAINLQIIDDHLVLSCVQGGETTSVRMSGFNAWRAFGMLSFMLGISLPAKLAKGIEL